MIELWTKGEAITELMVFEKGEALKRPRLNKHSGSVYSPTSNQNAVREALSSSNVAMIECPFWLTAHFFHSDNAYFLKTDVDNMLKALADNLQFTKIVKNDNQMMGVTATKNLANEDWIWLELAKADQINISLEDIKKMPPMPL